MTVMTFDLDDIMHYFCRIFRRIWSPEDLDIIIDIARTLNYYSMCG